MTSLKQTNMMYSVLPILFDLGDIILHVHQQFHRQL